MGGHEELAVEPDGPAELLQPVPQFSPVHSPIPPPSPVNTTAEQVVMDVHVDIMATPDMEEQAVLLDHVANAAIVTEVVMAEDGSAEVVAVTAGDGDKVEYIQVENLLNAYLKVYLQMPIYIYSSNIINLIPSRRNIFHNIPPRSVRCARRRSPSSTSTAT